MSVGLLSLTCGFSFVTGCVQGDVVSLPFLAADGRFSRFDFAVSQRRDTAGGVARSFAAAV